jgi:hypothetical protein
MIHYGADVLRNRELTLSLWVRQQGFHVFGHGPWETQHACSRERWDHRVRQACVIFSKAIFSMDRKVTQQLDRPL